MIDTIIFDLGAVLIDWNPRHLFRKIIADEERMEHFLANVATGEWNEQQDAGRPVAQAMDLLAAEHPEWEPEIRAFYGRWDEMLAGPIQGTLDILSELKSANHKRLFALTNWSAETFPIARERYDFLQWFEGIVVSGEEKLKKPDPAFYQILFSRYEVDPARALFIDDSPRNIAAGQELGMTTILFESPEALAVELDRTLGAS